MSIHEAVCACGQLRLVCEGPPARVAMCHCLECQRRTGSVFGVQAWFPREQVREPVGKAASFVRTADSGRTITFSFCPGCGSTVFWAAEQRPDLVAVAVGAFADPEFVPPQHSVWEGRRHGWTVTGGEEFIEHST